MGRPILPNKRSGAFVRAAWFLPLLAVVAIGLGLNSAARADTVGVFVNGTCEFGTCPPAPLAAGSSNHESFSFVVTLADGDQYRVAGRFNAFNTGASFLANVLTMPLLVQYTGNESNAPSQADTINVTTLANIAWTTTINGSRGPTHGVFSPGIASGSSITVNGSTNGVLDASLGTYISPASFVTNSVAVTFTPSGGQLLLDAEYSIFFAAGSPVGSYVAFNGFHVPEPGSVTLIAVGLLAVGAARRVTQVKRR